MKRYVARLATTALLIAASALAFGQKADADNERQALSMVSTQMDIIEEVRKYCGHELGQWKPKIDYIALKWTDQNIEAIRAVEAFKEQDASSKQQAAVRELLVPKYMDEFRARASSGKAEGVCGGFFQDISTGHQDVSSQTPRASGFLREYLKRHPLSSSAADKLNFTMGCLKSGIDNHVDHDRMIRNCACYYAVESTNVSKEEREQADKVARARGDVSSLPHMRRIRPLLQACATN